MKHRRFKVDPKKQIGARSNHTLFIFVSFAAILSLVVLGYIKLSEQGEREVVGVESEKEQASVTPSLNDRLMQKVRDALPEEGKGMVPPSVSKLYGRWFTSIAGDGIAEFTFKTNGYELLYVDSPQSPLRKFSVGKYNYDPRTGYLGLFPEYNVMPSQLQKGARYKVMTTRNFQMVVSQKSGDSEIYMTAHERDLAGKNYHPIFLIESYDSAPVLKFMPVSAMKK